MARSESAPLTLRLTGVLLFGFIPLVLWLYVGHPQPLGLSLAAGVALMIGHRFLARPYMLGALPRKCLWCNRVVSETALPGPALPEAVPLESAAGAVTARCCTGHGTPVRRFFTFVERHRLPLAAGIFAPLLFLLGSLLAAVLGIEAPVDLATDVFRLVVGVTVNVAAWGWLTVPATGARRAPRVPFPLHNFFLLGVRSLLWVFRLVGTWWIWVGASGLLARGPS
jgi:hypothetical protein